MADSEPTTKVKAAWNGGRDDLTLPVGHIPDAERALWRTLAGEVDAYLAVEEEPEPAPDDSPLF